MCRYEIAFDFFDLMGHIYDAISEKHTTYDDVWLDVQNKQAVGLQVSLMKK